MNYANTSVKYLVREHQPVYLHIVAYKGGAVVNTLCGMAYPKRGTRTITTVERKNVVCEACRKNL